ncbi:hypothetical protein ACVW17_005332 [Bradyrhizobium sp. USDA 4473]
MQTAGMLTPHRMDSVEMGFLGFAGMSFIALVASVSWLLTG